MSANLQTIGHTQLTRRRWHMYKLELITFTRISYIKSKRNNDIAQ